ncbi:heme biosynthesis protein HemY [Nisaea sp.]|uniref:heme biosynthesis protein HemY n=1 Tax=Nisaea sp. TaxID=2024842 RepID=UPI002B269609|nr:heme biosynthesis HemY N-terminal domain-containing protein [Nisaea sp.]
MLKFCFGLIILVGAITFAAIQLADNPGQISIDWLGYHIDTYFGVALLALLACLWLLLVVYRLFRGIVGLPGGFFDRRAERRRDEGVNALSLGMAAIAAGDAEEARKQAKRAEKLLNDPSKTRLLSAQAAALGGDSEAAGRYFDALTESPETRFVGLVGKLRQALDAGDRDEALTLALRARDLRPDSGFVARTLFTLETGAEDWDGAQKTLFDAVRRDLIPEGEAKRYRMAIDMERARLKQEAGDLGGAADFALRALAVEPAFPPAVQVAVEAEQVKGRDKKAQRLLEDAWSAAPHPTFAKLYAGLWPDDDPAQRLKRIQKLTDRLADGLAGRLAVAEAAIAAELWGVARAALEAIPDAERSASVFRLLAYMAQAERGDAAQARGFLERASNAPADPAWTCSDCGATSGSWTVSCGNCGHFATLTWKQPPRVSALVVLPESDIVPAPALIETSVPAEAPAPAEAVVGENVASGRPDEPSGDEPNPEDVVRRLA